jgi:rubredoxin
MLDYNCRNCGHIFDHPEVIRDHMRGRCNPAVV